MSVEFSLADLLADEALRRREFPVVEHSTYLAHAAVCPLPAVVARAMRAYLERVERGGQFEHLHAAAEGGARALTARLLGVSADEIAFVSSTSAGLGIVAAGLELGPGDGVVAAQGDFPSNVYPWLRLERHGVKVKLVPTRGDGLTTLEDVAAAMDETTRLVALSSVHFATGASMDLDAIGEYVHGRGALFCVDAIQSLGAFPVSTRHVDFAVADAHKWLLGPQGMGVLFVKRQLFERLQPVFVGWKSVRAQKDFLNQTLDLADTARRYEPGSLNPLGVVGLHAALELLVTMGAPEIEGHLRSLRAKLARAVADKGYEVVGPPSPASGIVSFRHPARDITPLHGALDRERIILSLRQDPLGRACLRAAPHLYTTEADIGRLVERL